MRMYVLGMVSYLRNRHPGSILIHNLGLKVAEELGNVFVHLNECQIATNAVAAPHSELMKYSSSVSVRDTLLGLSLAQEPTVVNILFISEILCSSSEPLAIHLAGFHVSGSGLKVSLSRFALAALIEQTTVLSRW